MSQSQLSVQLYTVRDALARDLPGTLRRVADLGYRNVELFGFVDLADQYSELLPAVGLAAPSAHAGLLGQDVAVIFEAAKKVGVTTVIDPSIDRTRWTTKEDIASSAADLNEIAKIGADHGLTVGYHNHWWETENRIGGAARTEVFADHLDAEVVLEVDTYWAAARWRLGGGSAARARRARRGSSTSRTAPAHPGQPGPGSGRAGSSTSSRSSLQRPRRCGSSSSTIRRGRLRCRSPTASPSSRRRGRRVSRGGRVGVGVIGAGVISGEYLDNLTTFPDLDVLFVADIDPGEPRLRRRSTASPAADRSRSCSTHPEIEIVVNLTIPAAHVEVATPGARGGQERLDREAVRSRPRQRQEAARRGGEARPARRDRPRHLPRSRPPVRAAPDRATARSGTR